jgi:hypothetical protein
MKSVKRGSARHPARLVKAESNATREQPNSTPKLEEQLDFKNVTEFRKFIHEAIPRLQENHFLRFVLTKSGTPVAVVMSYEAYGVLNRITTRVLDEDAKKDKGTVLREAYREMTGEDPATVASAAEPCVATGREIPGAEMIDFHQTMLKAFQEAMKSSLKSYGLAEVRGNLTLTSKDE